MKKIIIALIFSNAISSFGQEGIMKKEADDKGNATFNLCRIWGVT